MKAIARLLLVALVVCAGAVALRPAAEHAWFLYQLAVAPPPAALPHPVAARPAPRIVNSWGNPRPGGRRHEGIDIFAPTGTPVRSTTRGIVARIGTNRLGGNTVWILGPGLERHYYAHLSRYGAFGKGDRVEPGDIIGYTGSTGNARGGPAHLHYGIYARGSAQNPYPRLAAVSASRLARPWAELSLVGHNLLHDRHPEFTSPADRLSLSAGARTDEPALTYTPVAVTSHPPSPQGQWEAFIDALDRAGQAGNIAGVEIPAIAGAQAGKRFDQLTTVDVKELSRMASSQGCRGDVLVVMWRDLQWKLKQQKKAEQKRRRV